MSALTILERSPVAADESPNELSKYNELLGEVQCAAGQRDRGLALLKRRVDEEERDDHYPHAPSLARLRAVTGLCAAGAGDRTSALNYATQARAAFTAQPGVSPYYKAPLFKLERALGLRLPAV